LAYAARFFFENRIGAELHRKAAMTATSKGMTLNAFVEDAIKKLWHYRQNKTPLTPIFVCNTKTGGSGCLFGRLPYFYVFLCYSQICCTGDVSVMESSYYANVIGRKHIKHRRAR